MHIYDHANHQYFSASYLAPEIVEQIQGDPIMSFIEDAAIVQQIESVPNPFRRFIRIENAVVSVDKDRLIEDILFQLEQTRDDAIKKLESESVTLAEEIALASTEEAKLSMQTKLRAVVEKKKQWRDLKSSPAFSVLDTAASYQEVIDAVIGSVDPTLVASSPTEQIVG